MEVLQWKSLCTPSIALLSCVWLARHKTCLLAVAIYISADLAVVSIRIHVYTSLVCRSSEQQTYRSDKDCRVCSGHAALSCKLLTCSNDGLTSQDRWILTSATWDTQSDLPSCVERTTRPFSEQSSAATIAGYMSSDSARSTTHSLFQQPIRVSPQPTIPSMRSEHDIETTDWRLPH